MYVCVCRCCAQPSASSPIATIRDIKAKRRCFFLEAYTAYLYHEYGVFSPPPRIF